jgi:hypothetical protein
MLRKEKEVKKLCDILFNAFLQLIELESPEYALGVIESMKMGYCLVIGKKMKLIGVKK